MDNNDTITLTRKEFETLVKRVDGIEVGMLAISGIRYSPQDCVRISSQVSNDPGTQTQLQDFLLGALR